MGGSPLATLNIKDKSPGINPELLALIHTFSYIVDQIIKTIFPMIIIRCAI